MIQVEIPGLLISEILLLPTIIHCQKTIAYL